MSPNRAVVLEGKCVWLASFRQLPSTVFIGNYSVSFEVLLCGSHVMLPKLTEVFAVDNSIVLIVAQFR